MKDGGTETVLALMRSNCTRQEYQLCCAPSLPSRVTLSACDYDAFLGAVHGDDPPEPQMIKAVESVRHLFE